MTLRNVIPPEARRVRLKEILREKGFVRVVEAHNGMSALLANDTRIQVAGEESVREFDAFWESSFTDSASKGLPDAEIVSQDSRLSTIQQILDVTSKPIIVDGDTGGNTENFEYFVHRLENLSVSAVIVEDKKFPKRCSLDADARQELESPDVFSAKIRRGRNVLVSNDFMIIARIESIIAGYTVSDALRRARKYVECADGIMIHSKDKSPDAVLKFAKEYNIMCEERGVRKPLVCVPTTYDTVYENELKEAGFNIVIYANHLLRASYAAMEQVLKTILLHGRAYEANQYCVSVSTIFDTVGFTEIKQKDIESMKRESKTTALILDTVNPDTIPGSVSSLEVNGKSMLRRQYDSLKRYGITQVVVAGMHEPRDAVNVTFYTIDSSNVLHALCTLEEEIAHGFILIFSHILCDPSLIANVLKTTGDIVIVGDSSYPFYRDNLRGTALVRTKEISSRREISIVEKQVSAIGLAVKEDTATHEFTGIAKFSPRGSETLLTICKNYRELKRVPQGLHAFSDVLQGIIDRGFTVHLMETFKGWIAVDTEEGYTCAKETVF